MFQLNTLVLFIFLAASAVFSQVDSLAQDSLAPVSELIKDSLSSDSTASPSNLSDTNVLSGDSIFTAPDTSILDSGLLDSLTTDSTLNSSAIQDSAAVTDDSLKIQNTIEEPPPRREPVKMNFGTIEDSLYYYYEPLEFSNDFASITKSARKFNKLIPFEYEYPGHKGEILNGNSIMGTVGAELFHSGIQNYEYLPGKLGGYWSMFPYSYSASTLNLYGQNGYLKLEPVINYIDTPMVELNWVVNGPFGNRNLEFIFRRSLVDSVYFEFFIRANSMDSTGNYRYADVTHQLYLGTMGRDSSTIPFVGRNLSVDNQQLSASLIFQKPYGYHKLLYGRYKDKSDDAVSQNGVIDSLILFDIGSLSINHYRNNVNESNVGYNGLYKSRYVELETSLNLSTLLNDVNNLPVDTLALRNAVMETDSTFSDAFFLAPESYSHEMSFINGSALLSTPYLKDFSLLYSFDFATLSQYYDPYAMTQQEKNADREILYLQHLIPWKFLTSTTQLGATRWSSAEDQQRIDPAFSYQLEYHQEFYNHKLQVQSEVYYNTQYRYPLLKDMYGYHLGRFQAPNNKLKSEITQKAEWSASAKYDLWDFLKFNSGFSLRSDNVRRYITWASQSALVGPVKDSVFLPLDTNPIYSYNLIDDEERIFRKTNVPYAEAILASVQGGFTLGNWDFFIMKFIELRNKISGGGYTESVNNTFSKLYKGHVSWQNSFVSDRLGVRCLWQWEWFSSRESNVQIENHQGQLQRLKHFLVLDFEARMKIKTFEYYFRVDNFNHSILYTDFGYYPMGMNLKFGIHWSFLN